jgi:hypothetical protein
MEKGAAPKWLAFYLSSSPCQLKKKVCSGNGTSQFLRKRHIYRTRHSRNSGKPMVFLASDSQPKNVLDASKIWHTDGTQYEPNRDFLIARHP